jgi:hypothetical protein
MVNDIDRLAHLDIGQHQVQQCAGDNVQDLSSLSAKLDS